MRPRTRTRHPSARYTAGIGVAIVVLTVLGTALGTTAVTRADVDRGTAIDIASDPNAVVALDVSAAVHIDSTERLVTVTNHLDQAGSVTVSFHPESTDAADLVVDGSNEGEEVTITLAEGESVIIDAAVANDSSLVGDTVTFDVTASASSVSANILNRSVLIEE